MRKPRSLPGRSRLPAFATLPGPRPCAEVFPAVVPAVAAGQSALSCGGEAVDVVDQARHQSGVNRYSASRS